MKSNEERLYDKLNNYSVGDIYPYHMPGHKRRLAGALPKQMIEADITEIDGFDNLHQPGGILRQLQEKAARLYGAEESFYLINGSTSGILAAVSAAVPENGHILMARNCHKSAYHAVYLRNLTASYLYPSLIEEYDINDAITPLQVKEALDRESDIDAVLLVSPTYEGRIADVKKIAQIVHEKGIPLIVDEAHGAHLGWTEGFHKNSCQVGADLVIHSVHKTLPAMTQTALLHVNGELIDRSRLRRFLHIYQTSSPSYVLMASIDNALTLMEERGTELLAAFRKNYLYMLSELADCQCLDFGLSRMDAQDIGKLVISSKRFGLSGQRIYDILLEEYHLQLEMAAGNYCLAMFTVGDGEEAYRRMIEALKDIDKRMASGSLNSDCIVGVCNSCVTEHPNKLIPLGLAWDMPTETVELQAAIGRYVGEFVNLYPPGIPLLVPGEILTDSLYYHIESYMEQHLNVQGVKRNGDICTINVLRK